MVASDFFPLRLESLTWSERPSSEMKDRRVRREDRIQSTIAVSSQMVCAVSSEHALKVAVFTRLCSAWKQKRGILSRNWHIPKHGAFKMSNQFSLLIENFECVVMCFSFLLRMLDLSWSQVVSYFSKDFLLVSTDFGPGSQTYAGAVHRMPKRQTLRWSFRLWTCPAHVRFVCTFQARTDADRLSSKCTTVEEGNILGSFPYSLWRGDSGSCSSDMLRLGCRELVWRVWSKLNNKSPLFSEQSLLWKAWRANMNNELLEASWSVFCVNFAMCKALDLRQGRFWLCVKAAQPPAASGTAICELPHYGPAMPPCNLHDGFMTGSDKLSRGRGSFKTFDHLETRRTGTWTQTTNWRRWLTFQTVVHWRHRGTAFQAGRLSLQKLDVPQDADSGKWCGQSLNLWSE